MIHDNHKNFKMIRKEFFSEVEKGKIGVYLMKELRLHM